MPDDTPGWVQVRLIGPQKAVKQLAQDLASDHEVKADSGTSMQDDGQGRRTLTVRQQDEEPEVAT